ncbi:MAG: glycosyltransferase family 2 protein [Thermoflexales bacterium]|nr:glycosyltransferase family 2 protein [Thermoflexales bacterium]
MNTHLVLVSWNGAAHLQVCLSSVLAQSTLPASIWIVDNASRDDTRQVIATYVQLARAKEIPFNQIALARNVGFTQGANIGLRAALDSGVVREDDLLFLLNQDTVLEADLFANLTAAAERMPCLGAVGCKIYYPDGETLQHAGGYLERPRLVGRHYAHRCPDSAEFSVPREVEFVTGAAIGLRAAAVREVGLLNEIFSPGYYEDVEMCVRLRDCGWQVWYWPAARLRHTESASFEDWWTRTTLSERNRILFAMLRGIGRSEFGVFLDAELDFVRTKADFTTCRVLASAYGLVLARLVSSLTELPWKPESILEGVEAISLMHQASVEQLSKHYRALG